MKKHKFNISMIMGLLLIAAALCLTIYNIREEVSASAASSQIMGELLPELLADAGEKPESTGKEDVDLLLIPEMPVKVVDGREYIAAISIPSLELELPVFSTWDYTKLQLAPCHYYGSVYTDDFVVCAHNYNSHFGRIKNLNPGDSVIVVDMDGNVFNYEVSFVETLSSGAVEEMVKGDDWDLTLFTCTIGGATRVTVRCERVLY